MKAAKPTPLACMLVQFFDKHLPLRGVSTHTIQSYRDSLELFLRFVAADRRCEIEALNIKHFTATEVEEFLADLKRTRGNGTSTRNVRLAAVRIFARFVARHNTR